ncbi:MAG: hypothetical protein IK078_11380 [Lachnospiraceae bacterium]|nr:hypothetical protein [Lachnospiraceae bacterium]
MKTKKKLFVSLVLGMLITMSSYVAVFAATFTQGAQTSNSVTIAIDPAGDQMASLSVSLERYYSSENANGPVLAETAIAANSTSYTFGNLLPGTKYTAKIKYTTISRYTGRESTPYSRTVYLTTLPGKVSGLHQAKWWYWNHDCDFEWDKQDACKYEWVAYQKGKKSKQIAKSTTPTYSNSGRFKVKNNKMYTAKVRAVATIDNMTYYGDWSDEVYMFTQPMVLDKGGITIDGSGKMTVKWEKIDGVDSYEVYVSTKEKTGYKKVAKVKSSKGYATIKKLKKKKFKYNKTYYVYIVAKKKVKGKICTSGRHYTKMYKKGSLTTRWTFD